MKKISKTLIRLLTLLILMFSVFTTVYAQLPDYNLLAPLPGTEKTGCAKPPCTDLQTYIPGLINWSMGVAAVMAFVVIVGGGIIYMTSDAIQGKTQGREWGERAIWGLLLVIGAWVILNTINPQILNFTLTIPRPTIITQVSVVPGNCQDCVLLSTLNNISGSGSVARVLANKLTPFNTALGSARISWRVTEAYPPVAGLHDDSCHAVGTCIDANINTVTVANINSFLSIASQNNLNAIYEVKTIEEYRRLVRAGAAPSSKIQVNPGATAAHFHIKS